MRNVGQALLCMHRFCDKDAACGWIGVLTLLWSACRARGQQGRAAAPRAGPERRCGARPWRPTGQQRAPAQLAQPQRRGGAAPSLSAAYIRHKTEMCLRLCALPRPGLAVGLHLTPAICAHKSVQQAPWLLCVCQCRHAAASKTDPERMRIRGVQVSALLPKPTGVPASEY